MQNNVALLRSSVCANPQFSTCITVYPVGLSSENTTCWVISEDINLGDGHIRCGIDTIEVLMTTFASNYKARGSMLVRKLEDLVQEDVKVRHTQQCRFCTTTLPLQGSHMVNNVAFTFIIVHPLCHIHPAICVMIPLQVGSSSACFAVLSDQPNSDHA